MSGLTREAMAEPQQGKNFFAVQLNRSRIGNRTRLMLIHILLKVLTIQRIVANDWNVRFGL